MIGALSALLATNQPVALSNFVQTNTGLAITATNDPLDLELQKLMEADDDAQAEVDKWIRENADFAAKGAGTPKEELNRRILTRFASVRTGYETFLQQHTNHVGARVAYASFLNDIGDEEGQREQLEVALELDKTDPAIWNNLANYYGHRGSVTQAFAYYEKAISLNGNEPVYYHNFGTTVFLFRKDVKEYYHIEEQQVFDKALSLYSNAMRLAPDDFPLASDIAQTYYGIKPPRTEEALRAWTNTFNLAHDDIEREGVHTHFARVKGQAGRFAEAHGHLSAVTNPMYADLKNRLERSLKEKQAEAAVTNAATVRGAESPATQSRTDSPPAPLLQLK